MSVNLEPIPESPAPAPSEIGGRLAQIWRNIFPWGDLNAKLPPERYLSLGEEILPSLAVLAAQGPDQPRLLQTDLLARLLTVGSLNAVDKATAQKLIGSAVISVNNPNLFAPGSFVAVQPAAGGATLSNSQFYQVLGPTNNPGELSIAPALTAQVNPGDFIVGVPAVWIAGQSLNVQVGNSIAVNSLPAITIAAAQQVNIGNTVTVAGTINIGNVPSVTIASGTVSIGNTAQINILSQSVNVATVQPQSQLTDLVFPANTVNALQTTDTVPTGTHSLQLSNVSPTNNVAQFIVKGHTTGVYYHPVEQPVNGVIEFGALKTLVVPIDPVQDAKYDVICTTSGFGTTTTVKVTAILDTEAVWVQNKPETPVFVVQTGSFRPSLTGGAPYQDLPPPPYDGQAVSAPATGVQATVTLAAFSGQQWRASMLAASLVQGTGAASADDIQVLDGATVIWGVALGITAVAGDADHFDTSGVGIVGSVTTAMTFRFVVGFAGASERVSLGAYQQ